MKKIDKLILKYSKKIKKENNDNKEARSKGYKDGDRN